MACSCSGGSSGDPASSAGIIRQTFRKATLGPLHRGTSKHPTVRTGPTAPSASVAPSAVANPNCILASLKAPRLRGQRLCASAIQRCLPDFRVEPRDGPYRQMLSARAGRAIPTGRRCPCDPDVADGQGRGAALLSNRCQEEDDHREDDPDAGCVDQLNQRKLSGSVRAAEHSIEVIACRAGEALWCRLCRRIVRRMGSQLRRPHRRPPLFRCTDLHPFVREKSLSLRPARRSDSHPAKRGARVVEIPLPAPCH